MIDADFDAFSREFQRLSAALERTFKQTPEQIQARVDAYWTVLKPVSLAEVIAKADGWLERESKMPSPAQWKTCAPKRTVAEIPELTARAASEWLDAEQRRWQGDPCACAECVQAGISEFPIRFVPEFDSQDRDDRARLGQRVVTRGHYAHGAELASYYRAKEEFWHRMQQWFPKLKLRGDLGIDEKPRRERKVVEFTQVGR